MPFLKNIGTPEIIVIGIVLLFLFGSRKLKDWAHGIGEAGRELTKAKKEFQDSYEQIEGKKPIPEEPKPVIEKQKPIVKKKKPVKKTVRDNKKEEVG